MEYRPYQRTETHGAAVAFPLSCKASLSPLPHDLQGSATEKAASALAGPNPTALRTPLWEILFPRAL